MNPFHYTQVESPSAALTALAHNPQARFIAGGTNLLDLMKLSVECPPLVVDLNALPMRRIERRADAFYVGALARLSDVAADAAIREHFPLVAAALEESASPQLRNMASIGGNLLQRTRCPYFRDVATNCNKRQPGSGCEAIGGVNRSMAVLGTSDRCIAAHPSDLAVALVALGAVVHVVGLDGNRDVAVRDFYRLPGDTPQRETALADGELVIGISLPLLPAGTRSAFLKTRDRAAYEFALASAAVALRVTNGTIAQAHVALGGVATIPWHAVAAQRVLSGAPPSRELFERAANAELAAAHGHGGNDFKIALAKRTLVRALETVAAEASA